MAFDSARVCAVLFGGVSVAPSSQTASDHLLGDTWEEQGSGPRVQVTALTVNPETVAAGEATTIEADLSQRAPAGGAVVVVTAAGAAGVPNVEVPGGATSATATYLVPADTPPGDVTLTGQLAGSSQTATLHVTGAGGGATMAAFTITPSTIQSSSQGVNLDFQVDLTGPAPQGGVAVAVTYQGGGHRHDPDSRWLDVRADDSSGRPGAPWRIPVRRNARQPDALGDAHVGLADASAQQRTPQSIASRSREIR